MREKSVVRDFCFYTNARGGWSRRRSSRKEMGSGTDGHGEMERTSEITTETRWNE